MTVVNATTVEEALHVLDREHDLLMIQGGTDAMVSINFGHTKPTSVLALRRVVELREWHTLPDGSVFIGSGLPYAAMETGDLAQRLPALAQAARTVGSPQIRAAGTLGGNLGTCSPAGDALPVLSALEATVVLRSLAETREISIHDFMVGPKRNARRANELIIGVRVHPPSGFQGYAKVGVRNAMVIAVASACLVVDEPSRTARIALGSVGPTVIRCRQAEAALAQEMANATRWNIAPNRAEHIASMAATEARPIDDHRSTASYRRHAVAVLTKRLLERSNNV